MARKYIKNCTGDNCREKNEFGVVGRSSALLSKIIFHILLLTFIGVSFFVIFFSQYLKISNIGISGNVELKNDEIRQVVDSLLNEQYFSVISKNNFLLVSSDKFEKRLTGNFKKIRTVKIVKKFPDSISINIDERKALLLWCGNEKCYLIDENGLAYGEADFNSPELVQNHLLQVNDASGQLIQIGGKVVDPFYEKYILEIKDAIAKVGFVAVGEYSTPSRMADEIGVKTEQGPQIYFSTQYPLKSAVDALTTLFKKEMPADKKGDIEYIDLRNENKIFYKFKNQQAVENGSTANIETRKK